jgi:secretion/DNA translocation related TadE-like protein
MRRREHTAGQHGFATIWAVGWIGCLLTVGWLSLLLAVGVSRQHHLDGSADLVSLSAATALQHGSAPCTTARRIAIANHVELTDCMVDRDDVTISVEDSLALPLGLHLRITSRSRAGPA